tara:strand:- start:37 stop:726 length:690 start_codon:yes stop_codon:yes gene_type:complete
MSKETNINNIIEKIEEKLDNTGWTSVIGQWLRSEDHLNVVKALKAMKGKGLRFTPKYSDVFNSLVYCPIGNVKVVVIGQDPYPQPDVADGIAFSCSKKGKPEASLRYIFKALETPDADPDLKRWAEQGVLLLNTAMTVEVGNVGSHYDMWKPFMSLLLTEISNTIPNVCVVGMGKKAQEWLGYFPFAHKIEVSHPASAAYRKGGTWDHQDVFSRINKYLEWQKKDLIVW